MNDWYRQSPHLRSGHVPWLKGETMSDEIVDLNQKRLEKAVKESGEPLLGGPVPAGGQLVSVLGCSACGSTEFRLGHQDPVTGKERNIIICAKCCVPIGSLRWYDVNLTPPPGPAA
jgi:hypothetical protein